MKITGCFCVLALSITGQAYAEECSLDLKDLVPVLDANQTGIRVLQAPIKDLKLRHLTEAIELSDGTSIYFLVGGCVHYGYSFTYKNVKNIKKGIDKTNMLGVAKMLLEKTPLQKNDFSQNKVNLLTAIEATAKNDSTVKNDILELSCGADPHCSLEVPEDGSLTIGYDFPL